VRKMHAGLTRPNNGKGRSIPDPSTGGYFSSYRIES
jgi:hypothetical protein